MKLLNIDTCVNRDKDILYAALVQERKACRLCEQIGLTNPAVAELIDIDAPQVGPWTRWLGNLKADLMIVGQEWGDVNQFRRQKGRQGPPGDHDPNGSIPAGMAPEGNRRNSRIPSLIWAKLAGAARRLLRRNARHCTSFPASVDNSPRRSLRLSESRVVFRRVKVTFSALQSVAASNGNVHARNQIS